MCFYFYDPSTDATSWEAPVALQLPTTTSANESVEDGNDYISNDRLGGSVDGGGSRQSLGRNSSSSSSSGSSRRRRTKTGGAGGRSRVQELEEELFALTTAQEETAKAAAAKEQAFNEALAMATEEATRKEQLHAEALAAVEKEAQEKDKQHAAVLAAAAEAAAEQIVASAAEAAADATRKVQDEMEKATEEAKKPAYTVRVRARVGSCVPVCFMTLSRRFKSQFFTSSRYVLFLTHVMEQVYPENLSPVEHEYVVQEYMEHRVEGLNMATFQNAVSKVLYMWWDHHFAFFMSFLSGITFRGGEVKVFSRDDLHCCPSIVFFESFSLRLLFGGSQPHHGHAIPSILLQSLLFRRS